MGYLRDVWARDRRAEWSIWMVYSKVEMPHHYINSGADESSHRGMHRRVSSLWKINDVSTCFYTFHNHVAQIVSLHLF